MKEIDPRARFTRDRTGRIRLRWEEFANLHEADLFLLYEEDEDVLFRLEGCDLLGHDGLLWLLSAAQWRKSRGAAPLMLSLPNNLAALRYLRDVGFLSWYARLGGIVVNEYIVPYSEITPEGDRRSMAVIQPVTPSNWEQVLLDFWKYFENDVARVLGRSPSSKLMAQDSVPLRLAMLEFIVNIARHGSAVEGAGWGFVCYRPWPAKHPLLRFVCNDLGSGFRETLKNKVGPRKITSDAQGILWALIYRLHFPEDGIRGIYGALDFVRQLDGKLWIRSGDALVTLSFSNARVKSQFDKRAGALDIDALAALASCEQRPRVRGSHIALDLRRPRFYPWR